MKKAASVSEGRSRFLNLIYASGGVGGVGGVGVVPAATTPGIHDDAGAFPCFFAHSRPFVKFVSAHLCLCVSALKEFVLIRVHSCLTFEDNRQLKADDLPDA